MSETIAPKSSIGSLIASRRRRRISLDGTPPLDGPTSPPGSAGLRTSLKRTGEGVLEGFVFDPFDPDRRFVVELVLNGYVTEISRAALFDSTLAASGAGDGCHGFCFQIAPAALPSLRSAAVRIANLDDAVGETLDFTANAPFAPSAAPAGQVEWAGGLRISGWVASRPGHSSTVVEAHCDGVLVATGRTDTWRSVRRGGIESAEPGFVLTLPREFADGRSHQIDVVAGGRTLPGSPVTLIAFENGLRDFLAELAEVDAEQPRGAFFDAAFPDAVPFEAFEAWDRRFPLTGPKRPPDERLALAIIGEDAEGATLTGPGLDADDGWVAANLPSRGGPTLFDPGDFVSFLEEDGSDCNTVLFLPTGARVRPGLLDRLVQALIADPSADIAFPDILFSGADGVVRPLAQTAFDYERTLEQSGGALCFAMRRTAVLAAAGQGIGELHRLFLFPLDGGGRQGAAHLHVPGFGVVLPIAEIERRRDDMTKALGVAARQHLSARGIECEVKDRPSAFLPAVRVRRISPSRSLTLILDAGTTHSEIEAALEALEATRARTQCEIVATATTSTVAMLRQIKLSGVTFSPSSAIASRAERLARAAAIARGDLICFVDARLRAAEPGWLDELMARAAESDIGAVGTAIHTAVGTVAEAGWILRAAGPPVRAFADRRAGDPGYGDAMTVARQASAIGYACLMTRRSDFMALGGFDTHHFPELLGALDYCLKLQALGRRVVLTPDATLTYSRGAAANEEHDLVRARQNAREEAVLRARWPSACAADPFYSPLLDRAMVPFGGLAWPPGSLSPRQPAVSPARHIPPGW